MTKMTVNISEDLKLLLDESQTKPWRWNYKSVDGSLLFDHAHEALMDLHSYLLDKHLVEGGRTGVQDLITAFRISSSQILKEFNKYADELLKRPVEVRATPTPVVVPPEQVGATPAPTQAVQIAPPPVFSFKKGG